MEDQYLLQALQESEVALKSTTQGYKQHPPSYWANKTTNWYKGLAPLESVIAELAKRIKTVITISSTQPVVGQKIIATISVGK
jgi:hypothetical protein